jgi:hypothetical protein
MITSVSCSEAHRFYRGTCQLPWDGDIVRYTGLRIRVQLLTLSLISFFVLFCLTSCAFVSRHNFTAPSKDWQVRNGQLQYRTGGRSVIGDVLIRFSPAGDYELTFSKGPGVNLITIQQDATFARVKSSLTRLSWSGPPDRAPKQLRGWLSLREKLVAAPHQKVIRHTLDGETFVFRF